MNWLYDWVERNGTWGVIALMAAVALTPLLAAVVILNLIFWLT